MGVTGIEVATGGAVASVPAVVAGVVVTGVVVGGSVRVVAGTVDVVDRKGIVVGTETVGRVSVVVVGSWRAAAGAGNNPYPSNDPPATATRLTRPVRRPTPRCVGLGFTRPISARRFSICIGQIAWMWYPESHSKRQAPRPVSEKGHKEPPPWSPGGGLANFRYQG